MNGISLNKVERLSKTKGIKGWFSLVCLLAIMCFDQFVLEIPFMNIAFPILAVCAACMSPIKNIVLILAYSLIFELSCIAWMPMELPRVQLWLLEVVIGYSMPLICYKALNGSHKNISVFSYAAIASLGESSLGSAMRLQHKGVWACFAAVSLYWGRLERRDETCNVTTFHVG